MSSTSNPGRPAATRRSGASSSAARSPTAIDRVAHRPCALRGARPDATGRCDSAVFLNQEPLLPAELERLPLPTRAGPAAARAGGLPAGRRRHLRLRRRAALAALLHDRRPRAASCDSRLIQPQLRQAGVEVVPTYAPGLPLFGKILPERRLRRRSASPGFATPEPPGSTRGSSAAAAPRTATGYCQRLVTRDLDQADRILDADAAGPRPEQGRRAAGARRARDPALPAPVRRLRQIERSGTSSSRLPFNPLWNAEDWWLER